jgi:hypothetical protein
LKVTEQGLLDGFERFLQMLDLNFKPEDESSVSAVKKLLAGYMPLLMEAMKKTSLDCGVGMLSWNAIIDITKRSWFFEENPKHLVELNPDLVRTTVPPESSF